MQRTFYDRYEAVHQLAGGAAVCWFETGTESLGRSADHVDGVVVDAGRAVLRCAHGQFVSMI